MHVKKNCVWLDASPGNVSRGKGSTCGMIASRLAFAPAVRMAAAALLAYM